MSAVELFHFDEEPIRVVTDETGEPWFVAADVARILGYSTAKDMTRSLDEDEKGGRLVPTPGGAQDMTAISEAGMYSAILQRQTGRMNPVSAEQVGRFKRWVTHDVLPQIRKTGGYGQRLDVAAITRSDLARMILESEAAREAAEAERDALKPSAEAWNHLASTAAGDYSMNEAAKVLARDGRIVVGEVRLRQMLIEWGWVYRNPQSEPRAYQSQVDTGRLAERVRSHHNPRTGELVMDTPQVRVTAKGIEAIYRRLTTAVAS